MSDLVLDASVVLALIKKEPRGRRFTEQVDPYSVPAVSTVNIAETVGKLAEIGMPDDEIEEAIDSIGLAIMPFTREHARVAGLMRAATRKLGLSLGDRACLALAKVMDAEAVTTDQQMGMAVVGVQIRVVV